jgi:hypothetical protein
MKNPQYSWREGTDYFPDCMFDIADIENLKLACSHKFAMSAEEFDELVFSLIKEDIVNEDSNRD